MEKFYTVNRVEGFDPYAYLIPMKDEVTGEVIKGQSGQVLLYLPAAAKKVWFRKAFPEGCVLSRRLPRDDGQFEFVAKVYRCADDVASGVPIGEGAALRAPAQGEKYRPFESAQTLAEARALESAGFGSEVSLYLLMQEAEQSKAAQKEVAASSGQKQEAGLRQPVLTVKTAQEAAQDDEALHIFEQLGVKGAGKSKKSRKTKSAEKEAVPPKKGKSPKKTPDPADYIITAADAMGCGELDPFIGKSLAQLGKEGIAAVLSLAEGQISPQLKLAAEEMAKEAA